MLSWVMLDAAMPPETGAVLLANVTFLSEMLLLSRESGACSSVRFRLVKKESLTNTAPSRIDMRAEKGGSVADTLLICSERSIVAFTPAS